MNFETVRRRPLPERGYPRKSLYSSLVFLLCVLGAIFWLLRPDSRIPEEEELKPDEEAALPIELPSKESAEKPVRYTVVDGDIPADIFKEYGRWGANETAALLSAGKEIFDFANLKVGREIRFYYNSEERATRLEYEPGTEKIVIAEREGTAFRVREEKINYSVEEAVARGTIDDFFYADALEAGLQEPTVLEVGDIFSFSIDFTTEIRAGDQFVFVYEKRQREGKEGPDGRVLAAKFVNDGASYYAYYFENGGSGGYYDGEGRALERQFLKAPLSFRRITSGFTGRRMHPITRKVSAHYQIDYAAPSGTPVSATARGTVVSAGWEGGWGNMIRLRHDNGYTSHYGHLSAFAKGLRSGMSVAQGQLIGFVGSTGWSTGPHLDYGLKLNGSPVNPLKLDQPKGAPLDAENMDLFKKNQEQYRERLES